YDSSTELKKGLRAYVDYASDSIPRWDAAAQSRAAGDALRLLITFARGDGPPSGADARQDHYLHVRVRGSRRGSFDLYYDSLNSEPVAIGQLQQTEKGTFLDVWASFAPGASDRSRIVQAHSRPAP